MTQLCCLSLTLSTRIIATFGLSVTILMLNILISEYFSRTEDFLFLNAIQSWNFVGIHWMQLVRKTQTENTAQIMLICVIVNALISLLANGALALGSLKRNVFFPLPWIYYQMLVIIDQTLAIAVQLTYNVNLENYLKPWYLPLSSTYLVISVYFWVVVCAARVEWLTHPRRYNNFWSTASSVSLNDSNVPKSPSFISGFTQITPFDLPKTPLPPKFVV